VKRGWRKQLTSAFEQGRLAGSQADRDSRHGERGVTFATAKLQKKSEICKFFIKKVAAKGQKMTDYRKIKDFAGNICKCAKILVTLHDLLCGM
jgi:hypothetical protein